MKRQQINWPSFEACNPNVEKNFEYMCGSLFRKMHTPPGTILQYSPNNPGIECDPTEELATGKRISFQAKYFSSRPDYSQIEHSANETVKNYAGKIDKVFLYCNKDLSLSGAKYTRIKELLNANGIELVPVTNRAILDAVIDYPQIVSCYFSSIFLTQEWFEEKLDLSLAGLGRRYNGQFNICTGTEHLMDLFYRTNEAAMSVNQKKSIAIDELRKNKWRLSEYRRAVNRAIDFLQTLPDVDRHSLQNCLRWPDLLQDCIAEDIAEAEKKATIVEEQYNQTHDKEKWEEYISLEWFIAIPELLRLSANEECALVKNVVIIDGEAGMGKSHLLATMTKKVVSAGRKAILLLGQAFLSDYPISAQIPQQLELDIDIRSLLLILNELGERQNEFVVVCIDALNESGNKGIWKNGLSGLITTVQQMPYVKVLASYRTGYNNLVLGESVEGWLKSGQIVALHHEGLRDEGPGAVQDFLNHYGIPFSPEYYLQSEMANPLFLTLFCETYDGSLVDVGTLIDRIIKKADQDIQGSVGLDGTNHILTYLLKEFAEKRIESNRHEIKKQDILALRFWDLYGISQVKLPYLSGLVKYGILSEFAVKEEEYYSFGYNLFEDYLCARTIFKPDSSKEETIKFIGDSILGINSQEINYSNIGVFIAACAVFAEQYREECVRLIDLVKDEFDRYHLENEYVKAFSWRKREQINPENFFKFISTKRISAKTVFPLLLECAAKTNHPLNALFLHNLLFEMSLPQRDSLWTIFINGLYSEEHRIANLILFLDKGGKFDTLNEEASRLLSIVLVWMLSSSNRFLRDKASKALVELLRDRFKIALELLSLFEGVNDPYIVQRLYGVVFGACVKRHDECRADFDALCMYVYVHVFIQEYVYPDILLRDYARLIVERYIYEYPQNAAQFDLSRVRPPYQSLTIPVVEHEPLSKEYGSGIARIERSMSPNYRDCGLGLYGNFGRYVFEASVSSFKDVDIPNLYHYALHLIKNDLGYSDELFSEYDSEQRYYFISPNDARKIERIGKKYQWIAYYNILARLSDTNLISEWDKDSRYEGPWDPYVRDFDPTLNMNSNHAVETPSLCTLFSAKDDASACFIDAESSDAIARDWSKTPCCYYDAHISNIISTDSQGIRWVVLHQHNKIQSEPEMIADGSLHFKNGAQYIWLSIEAIFVSIKRSQKLGKLLNSVNFRKITLDANSVYQLYNREYYWAPSANDIIGEGWAELRIPTEKPKEITKKKMENSPLLEALASYGFPSQTQTLTFQEAIYKVLLAYTQFLWEEEYDASNETTISFDMPCKAIVEHLNLTQKETDGFFFAEDGTLVAFDSSLVNLQYGLIIRKDYLDTFLKENGLVAYWICTGEKQFFKGDRSQIWSEWQGLFRKKRGKIEGEFLPREND